MSKLVIDNCIVCPMYENAIRQIEVPGDGEWYQTKLRTIRVFICKHPDREMIHTEEDISDERFGELCNDVSHDCPLRENPLQLCANVDYDPD